MDSHADSIKSHVENQDDLPAARSAEPNLKDPSVILELLEADQVFAAKQQTRFGFRKPSPGLRALLWGLRVYAIAMFVVVVISVIRALQATP